MKKISLLLAILMLVPTVLTACSESEVNSDETSPSAAVTDAQDTSAETEEAAEQTVTDMVKDKYTETDLDGYEYRVLAPPNDTHMYPHVGSGINEVYAEEMNGELINDALWERNSLTMDLINISITPVWASGDPSTITSQLSTEVMAGTTAYDTVLNRMDYLGTSMINGELLNIKNIDTIDTANLWWDKNIVDTFTVFDNKLYFISGDINIFDDFAVEVIYFNKQLCDDNGLAYPYADVMEGKWTIDKCYQMSKAVERDLNGDGKMVSTQDILGHCENNDHVKHWIYAMGEKSIDLGEHSELTINVANERHVQAVDTIFEYMVTRQMTGTASTSDFTEGRVLFFGDMLGPINRLREMEQPFGVIPMPKMNEEQETYGNYVSNGWTTAYAVPMTNIKNVDTIGTILEVLCGFSTDTLRSALYDVLFAAKLVRDNESVEMLNIIFSTKSYDWAVDFTWGSTFANLYNNLYFSGTNTYASNLRSNKKVIEKALDKIFTKIEELDY